MTIRVRRRALAATAAVALLTAIGGTGAQAEDVPLASFSGDHAGTTPPFKIDSPWRIDWSCVPAGTMGIWSYPAGRPIKDKAPDKDMVDVPGTVTKGFEAGSAYHRAPGAYYLQVQATCSWEINIFAVPKRAK